MFQSITSQLNSYSSLLSYLVIVLGVTSIASVLGWRWWKENEAYKSLKLLPSPPQYWVLGNFPQILAAVKQKKLFQQFFDWSQQLGPMYVIWNGQAPIVILSKPKVIEDTIINGMRDGSLVRAKQLREAWNDMSGAIMLGETGTEWQWRRKAWNPEFTSSNLSKYIEIISQVC